MNNTKYQCLICKKSVRPSSEKGHELDPCAVVIVSNCDQSHLDQKEQTFFCHFECFKKVNDDDSVVYLQSLSTQREIIDEDDKYEMQMESLCSILKKQPDGSSFWQKLFDSPKGRWLPLKNVISPKEFLILATIKSIQEDTFELLIMWVEDYSTSYIEQTNSPIKIIYISDDPHDTNYYITKRYSN